METTTLQVLNEQIDQQTSDPRRSEAGGLNNLKAQKWPWPAILTRKSAQARRELRSMSGLLWGTNPRYENASGRVPRAHTSRAAAIRRLGKVQTADCV